jgi:UDP-N-acetylmuramoylalanine--D-glutamate ligase
MISLDAYKNKTALVLGFGKTGRSVVDSLMSTGAKVYIYDDFGVADEKYGDIFLDFSRIDWNNLDIMVVSPGISVMWPSAHKAIRMAYIHGVPLINDVDLFQRHVSGRNICVTGTNGKSTTAALINRVLDVSGAKASIGGNFGIQLLSLDAHRDFYVLELSSYQLETCNILGFDTAILLNITPDHLTRHGGMFGYVSAKQKIFANFHEKSTAVIGVDDEHCLRICEVMKAIKHPNIVAISGTSVPERGVGWHDGHLVDNIDGNERVVCSKYDPLDGVHNRQNIAAAYAACVVNGVGMEAFRCGLHSFKGLEHRQELVATLNGIKYINDSKATNAQSTEQALMRFHNIFWILGGSPKEDGIESLTKHFHKVKHAFLIGEVAHDWYNLLSYHGIDAEICGTLDVAVARAHEMSRTGEAEVILLSPACASFDQFKNFEERGKKFKDICTALAARC